MRLRRALASCRRHRTQVAANSPDCALSQWYSFTRKQLLPLDVPGRLAKWLLTRAGDPTGEEIRPGASVELRRSQGELAAELGTNRSTLNRALQSFANLGYVTVDGDRVVLHDPARLAANIG
jgi:CRP-like cAMP-binding protein